MKKIVFAIIILFINFQILEDYTVIKILPALLFITVIFEELVLKKSDFSLMNKGFYLLFILVIIIVVGILTSKRLDTSLEFRILKVVTFFSFFVAYISTIFNKAKKGGLLKIFVFYFYIPVSIYVSLNLLFFFLGLQDVSHEIGNAVILSYFGLEIQRVQFVLALGINGYGALVGVVFNISLLGVWVIRRYNKIFLVGLFLSLITLLLTDSRGPILYSILIFLVIRIVYVRVKRPKLLWLIPLIGFLGPILMLTTLSLLAQTSYGAALSRGSEDLATGNSRSIIWTIAGSEFLDFKPEHHIFGYGEFGQYAAGLSQQWAYVFGDVEGVEYMHPHNTFLSIALDYGYFGLSVFTILQFSVIRIIKKNWNSNRFVSSVLLGNILYFNLVGIGESMFGFYYRSVIYVFFMINIFAFVMDYHNNINQLKKRYV
jgi:hypothetical protein